MDTKRCGLVLVQILGANLNADMLRQLRHMFDPVRLFWTTLEVVLESLCEGGAQGSSFYKWTTLKYTAITKQTPKHFHDLVYTTCILPLRLCRFRFGMRFCTFFLIFIPLHFTHVCGFYALNRTHKASCFFASAM